MFTVSARPRAAILAGLCVGLVTASACRNDQNRPRIEIATTSSVVNSGLLDRLLPRFKAATVRVHAAGSGRALQMLADGQVALVISHAPEAEERRLAEHPNWCYRKIAHNRFAIVGPDDDPSRVGDHTTAVEAFRVIADSGVRFISRGDGSGTHEREQKLWRLAGVEPRRGQLLVSGTGMAQTLRQAAETRSYTLSDEATFWQLADGLGLKILVQGDPELINTYAVIDAGDPIAASLADWLSKGEGRKLIADFRIAGKVAFSVWPSTCESAKPQMLPCAEP